MITELTGEQLKVAEAQLKTYLPRSQQAYGCLVLMNRFRSDPATILVDRWPEFSVMVYKPLVEQKGDIFKDTVVFATDDAILKETISSSFVIDWTRFICLGINLRQMEIINAVASEKNVPGHKIAVCHMMILEDVSKLPSVDSLGISVSSLDESHLGLVNQKWKYGSSDVATRMIRNMITNLPSCCVLDAEGKPVSWTLTYTTGAMGMLYTLPEHRGKGYAKTVIITMAKKLHALGCPVYCLVMEENIVSYSLFKSLGFTEDPSYRESWFGFNNMN